MNGLDARLIALQHASPPQVIDEVLGRNTMEPRHPALQPAVIGIDVLDVEGSFSDPLPRPGMHDVMRDSTGAGKGGVNGCSIRAQHRLAIDQRQEGVSHMRGIELVQLEVGSVSFTVANHHNRDLVFARSTRGPDTAALASRPGQAALSLEGLQEEGLIRFDNAALTRIAMPCNGKQKTVSPQESSVFVDATMLRRLPEREAIDQGLGVGMPAIGFAQVRQGCAGQGIAGTRAPSCS